ncbi:early endosome antigen 1-like isoform X3 [Anthonomus grandis grandis]|nr:early endosome antigen 1-like isoform X3 [Anthonomus grandis grandis]
MEKNKLVNRLQKLEKEKCKKKSKFNIPDHEDETQQKDFAKVDSGMTFTEDNIVLLEGRLKAIEEERLKLIEDNSALKNQLLRREEEIDRLHSLLEGGRSYSSASKDCCYKNIEGHVTVLQDEITRLRKDNIDLKNQLKDSVTKQHEAMKRALHLAERNRQLEKEMEEVDKIALAVETECNNTVKGHNEKITRLQDRINESLNLIQNLERESAKLKHIKLELTADLEAIKLEKVHLQKQLEIEKKDKKILTDKINSFTIIENNLNTEIDRLAKLNGEQKQKIVELESLVMSDSIKKYEEQSEDDIMSSQKPPRTDKEKGEPRRFCKKGAKVKSPTKSRSPLKLDSNTLKGNGRIMKCCCETGSCVKHLKELLDKEVEYREMHAKKSLEDLRQEKDYYMKEYHKILEQVKNVSRCEVSDNGILELKQQLQTRDDKIKQLKNHIHCMSKEKQANPDTPINGKQSCSNASCICRNRELEYKTKELERFNEENNKLKLELQALNDNVIYQEDKAKEAFKELEDHIRKLEDERRDLVKMELTHRTNISHLEEDYKNAKEQLRQSQNELMLLKTNYNQLKLVQEQTQRSLSEVHAQVIRAETELATFKSKMVDSGRDSVTQDREITRLNTELQFLKCQLSKGDRDKKELLNNLSEKTMKITAMEDELREKNKVISKLESELGELNRKLSKFLSENASQNQEVRSKQQELTDLEKEYQNEKKLKEVALLENRRLQNELAEKTCDCKDARTELELAHRQVEDLKRQLQHYVAEVKRTEDIISHKELERNELLDQFRCLSQEANILESNNHTLETEATQSKIQLSVALDHSSELERKLDHYEVIIKSYEKQIQDLTGQVARLELQLKQKTMEQEQCNADIKEMRELCVKLDADKANLRSELYSKEDCQFQAQKVNEKFGTEKEALQRALNREKNSLEGVEKLLNETRYQVTQQKLLNQELLEEVGALKKKIEELEDRLTLHGFKSNRLRNMSDIKMPSKVNSILSTKTLKQTNIYHGSDGLLQGALDLLDIKENEIKGNETALKDINPTKDQAKPARKTSILSTKTLENIEKYHGSDGKLQGVMDLTKLQHQVKDGPPQNMKTIEKSRSNTYLINNSDLLHSEESLVQSNSSDKNLLQSVDLLTTKYTTDANVLEQRKKSDIDATHIEHGFSKDILRLGRGNELRQKGSKPLLPLIKYNGLDAKTEKSKNKTCLKDCKLVQEKAVSDLIENSKEFYEEYSIPNNLHTQQDNEAKSYKRESTYENGNNKAIYESIKSSNNVQALTDNHLQRSKMTESGSRFYKDNINSVLSEHNKGVIDNCGSSEITSLHDNIPSCSEKSNECNIDTSKLRSGNLGSIHKRNYNREKPYSVSEADSSSFLKDLREYKSQQYGGCTHDDPRQSIPIAKNCRSRKCFSSISISEPDIQRQYVNKDILGPEKCIKNKGSRASKSNFLDDQLSVTSTRTLNLDNVDEIRTISKGKTNISDFSKNIETQKTNKPNISNDQKSQDKMSRISARTLQVSSIEKLHEISRLMDVHDKPLDEKKDNLSLNADQQQKFNDDVISTKTLNLDNAEQIRGRSRGLMNIFELPKNTVLKGDCSCRNLLKQNDSLDKRVNKEKDEISGKKGKVSGDTQVYTKFEKTTENSAIFHKVFAIDGIGLECHCSISSFNLNKEKKGF